MSFIPVPASYAWLQTADPNTVRHEHFVQCMTDYIAWQRACGVPEEYGFTDPEAFIEAGGLQEYINVVNRSEEHTSELQSLMRISYAVFCLKKKTKKPQQ